MSSSDSRPSVAAPGVSSCESPRTRLVRHPERGSYDRAEILAVLDAHFLCHIAFATADGPVCLPTCYGRLGDRLVVHGAPASRAMRGARDGGLPLCLTVTLVDGLVLGPSAFAHSLNFRSVVVVGTARAVIDPAEKEQALAAITNQVIPGRWAECRPMTTAEAAATAVMSLPLTEASLKRRSGDPGGLDEVAALGAAAPWTGVVPLALTAGPPQPVPAPDPAPDPAAKAAALPESLRRLAVRHPAP